MKRVMPSIYKTKEYKQLMKELGKPPKVTLTPVNQTPEELKKAKILQKLINYQFKTNHNGITTRYFDFLERCQKEFAHSMLYGVKVRWDILQKVLEKEVNL